jgi:NAD(P)H-hydrate repair Nnr-like enzyme with NAD(P)H-hydrate dehydratase domain
VENDNQWAALCAAARWKTLVAAKGATTHIAIPSGIVWKHTGGNVGLATSGSGDVLAGIITGLAARGACVEQAAVWAVRLHALAGDELQRNLGRVGYLAREIPSQIPFLMDALARPAEAESSGPSVRQLSGKETSQKNAKSQDRSRTN